MLPVFSVTDDGAYQEALRRVSGRASSADTEADVEAKTESVRAIIRAVRERGDAAVAEFTSRFDGVDLGPDAFEIPMETVEAAAAAIEPDLMAALRRAHDNICTFHAKHLRESWEERGPDGEALGQRITPLASAGVYVPGGTAFYPSSVLMNIVPARVAGVRDIIMVSPPSYQGTLHPLVLAAAYVAGATRVFRVGGAQAVAALAYGTAHIPPVLKITGPGNIYVTVAKRLVSSVCDIDKDAGPSEVVVVADEDADPRLVAIELLCQAEHDTEACAVLIATSASIADAVQRAMEDLLGRLSRASIIREALARQGAAYVVRSRAEAAALANAYAPEHLSLQVTNPRGLLDAITDAGAVMLGGVTPVASGDYYAGPNHILPTGRRARFSSALTVEDFRKVTNYIEYTPEAIRRDAADIMRLAHAESFDAHAMAVELRT